MKKGVIVGLLMVIPNVSAHGNNFTWGSLAISSLVILVVVFLSLMKKKIKNKEKKLFFIIICVATIVPTLYISISTVYINVISETKGPIHWHADFEIWNCGREISFKDPRGWSNKIGSPLFHEHGDERIHVEGTVLHKSGVSLKEFFKIVGGKFSNTGFSVNTEQEIIKVEDGEDCSGNSGKVQVFLYKTKNSYSQQKNGFLIDQVKLENPEEYILSEFFNVPPGDCLIIEFDQEKLSTDKICETYRVALEKGDAEYGS